MWQLLSVLFKLLYIKKKGFDYRGMQRRQGRPAYLFKTPLHLSEWESELEVNDFFKLKKKFTKSVHVRSAKPNGRRHGRLCQGDRCYPWKSFLLYLLVSSMWAFLMMKCWQMKTIVLVVSMNIYIKDTCTRKMCMSIH